MGITVRRARARWHTVAAITTLAVVATACGSDDSSSAATSGSAAEGTTAPANTASGAADILAEATRISDLAISGLVWAPADSGGASTDIVAQTAWLGPESTPAPPAGVDAQIVFCAPGTACETAADYTIEAATAIGWNAEKVAGAGTAESFTQAFDTALSKDPDVILSMAVPDVLVGASLAKAREQGVITISVGDVPAATVTDGYDAYVSYRMPLMHQVNAYHIIAETGGDANVLLINDSAYPNLVESNNQFQRVMSQCSGCSVKVVEWQITDAMDPVAADSAITAALQGNPDATHIVMPYSIGISSVIEAVRKAGKSDSVEIVAKDGDEAGLQAIVGGGSSSNAGVSLEWVAYAGVDQAIRGLTESGYLPPEELGLGMHLFTAENTPADGIFDYSALVDFKTRYLELWGVG